MGAERQKMIAGELYDPLDPELVTARDHARAVCHGLVSLDAPARRQALKALLASGGESASIEPPFFCDYGFNIELGDRVYFNTGCVVLDVCRVRIGSGTLIAPGVHIYTATHPLDARLRRTHELGRPVTIGEDVWIGGGAIILPGVTIGDRSVIGAGSVVTKDVPSDVVAVGNPCRVLKRLDPGLS